MVKVPCFHYTKLDNLFEIFKIGQLHSRSWLHEHGHEFEDISIDPEQAQRAEMGLLEFVPLFAGFYRNYRSYDLNGYLMQNYDEPKRVYNRSFYGSLNKTLQEKMGDDYERVVLLLISGEKINHFADKGYVQFFTDIAIKGASESLSCHSKDELLENLNDCISNNDYLYAEIDILDDGDECILVPDDIEAIIVDNENVLKELKEEFSNLNGVKIVDDMNLFVSPLPRD